MSYRAAFRWTVFALPLVLGVLVLAAPAYADYSSGEVDAPASNKITQGAAGEERPGSLASGIAVHNSQGSANNDPSVVYSVNLPNLNPNETLRIAATMRTSFCVDSDISGQGNPGSPCKDLVPDGQGGTPHQFHYPVHVDMHIYQANGPAQKSDGSHWIATDSFLCSDDLHHCSSIKRTGVTGLNGNNGNYINVEAVAWNDNTNAWQNGQMIELEGDCSGGTNYGNCNPTNDDDQTTKSNGLLSIERKGSGYQGRQSAVRTTFDKNFVNINPNGQSNPQVVKSIRVQGLEAGDVIEVDGSLHLDGSDPCSNCGGYQFSHDVQAWWVLAKDDSSTTAGAGERFVSGNNQWNCLNWDGTGHQCDLRQVGLVTVPAPPADNTLHLNYVVVAKDDTTTPPPLTADLSQADFQVWCDPKVYPDNNVANPCDFQ
jgi:hypothetical protein